MSFLSPKAELVLVEVKHQSLDLENEVCQLIQTCILYRLRKLGWYQVTCCMQNLLL